MKGQDARMATCEHCGTEYTPRKGLERYCCHGCEYVARLIAEQGFDQFYDLKQGLAVAPVRSRPFEEHDWSWLGPKIEEAEEAALEKGGVARLTLGLEGISCVGCVWLVEQLFERHPGSVRAMASPSQGRMQLEWVAGQCDLEEFLRELCRFGYVACPPSGSGGDHERRRLIARLGLCGAFALNTMGFSLPVYLGMPEDFEFADLFRMIALLSATLSMLVGGGYFIDRAWRAARVGSLHIDLPIALGLVSAYAGSLVGWAIGSEHLMYFDFVSIFVFLMLAGRYLQTTAVDRNRRRLNRQQPVPESLEIAEGERVELENLKPGLRFLLEPGQALPVSGVLSAGEADFSLEWIHGEPDPVRHEAGGRLPGGAILLSRSPVWVEAGEAWNGSLLSKLTANEWGDRATPVLERVLRVYLVVVLLLGAGACIGWAMAGDWRTGLQAMISIFVVSCPCALGLAIPLADDLAASAMERHGLFVRTATLWPRLRQIRTLIFDKTGTLTLERPMLTDPDAVDVLSDEQALALARLTQGSLHPVSRALLEALGGRGQDLLKRHGAGQVIEHPGLGVVVGEWSLGRTGWVPAGNSKGQGEATELRQAGELQACFHFRESLRPGATKLVDWLRHRGFSMHILSGDHPAKVGRMARALGLDETQVQGGLSPEDKARRVKQLDHKDTLFLGDGANDSMAFDAAWVTGTPVVDRSLLEAKADFFTLGSGLEFLSQLLEVARSRALAVRSVFAFALVYNAATVGVSMAGHMSPLLAAVLMPLSSVVSILLVARLGQRKFTING